VTEQLVSEQSVPSGINERAADTRRLSIPASPHDWPLLGPAEPKKIALVVIDMQVDMVRDGGWLTDLGFDLSLVRAIIPRIKGLLDAARSVPGMNIVHFTNSFAPDFSDLPDFKREQAIQNGTPYGKPNQFGRGMIHGEPGSRIIDELVPLPGELVFNKPSYSAFESEAFQTWLREHEIGSLIITGVTSNVCVSATLYSAVDRGYDCLTISDGIAGVTESVTENLLTLVRYQGGLFGAETKAASAERSLRSFADPSS
jgi:nicotinamidase-related amidase